MKMFLSQINVPVFEMTIFNICLRIIFFHSILFSLKPNEYFKNSLLSWTEEPAKSGTCAHDRRALHQLVLNVHVKHSDVT